MIKFIVNPNKIKDGPIPNKYKEIETAEKMTSRTQKHDKTAESKSFVSIQ